MRTQLIQQKISELASRYGGDGFNVIVEPHADAIPFDLGGYRPALLASRGDENHIVEVRESGQRLSVDRFQELAEEIGRHPGWRFLLVTCEDLTPHVVPAGSLLLSWAELQEQMRMGPKLLELGADKAALVSLWGVFEGMLRHQAIRISLPIERFPTSGLLNHMYSHGELSMEQFDLATELHESRIRAAHGFATHNLHDAAVDLLNMIDELFHEWNPRSAAA